MFYAWFEILVHTELNQGLNWKTECVYRECINKSVKTLKNYMMVDYI